MPTTNADAETPSPTRVPLLSAESLYPVCRDGESVSTPLLAQLRALGFSDRQLRTLARLSPETQEEVYQAVMTLMLSDDPVLDDFLGTV